MYLRSRDLVPRVSFIQKASQRAECNVIILSYCILYIFKYCSYFNILYKLGLKFLRICVYILLLKKRSGQESFLKMNRVPEIHLNSAVPSVPGS